MAQCAHFRHQKFCLSLYPFAEPVGRVASRKPKSSGSRQLSHPTVRAQMSKLTLDFIRTHERSVDNYLEYQHCARYSSFATLIKNIGGF